MIPSSSSLIPSFYNIGILKTFTKTKMFKPKKRFKTKSEIENPMREHGILWKEENSCDDMFNYQVKDWRSRNTVKGKLKHDLKVYGLATVSLMQANVSLLAVIFMRIQDIFAICAGIALSYYVLYPLYNLIS